LVAKLHQIIMQNKNMMNFIVNVFTVKRVISVEFLNY